MRAHFDLDPDLLYLNSGNQSICPRMVNEAIQRHRRDYERNPTEGLARAWGRLWKIQTRLAHFFGAHPQDIFLRPNITSTLNTFILGTPLKPGTDLLFGELEYGAIVNICRLRAERERLNLKVLNMPVTPVAFARLTKAELVNSVVSQLTPTTGMLLLSHVIGGTGLRMPIAEIARETRKRGIWLVVDGAYAPGAFPVDFRELADVDFYSCSLYKWCLAPKGTAFGWVHGEAQNKVRPLFGGWTTFESFGVFEEFGGGSRFQERFGLSGCQDFAPFFALEETLDFWEARGPAKIYERRAALLEEVRRSVPAGWRCLEAAEPELRGPLLTVRLPARLQAAGAQLNRRLLEQHRLQINVVSLRGVWHAVFSPHVYNTEEEIAPAIAILKGL